MDEGQGADGADAPQEGHHIQQSNQGKDQGYLDWCYDELMQQIEKKIKFLKNKEEGDK